MIMFCAAPFGIALGIHMFMPRASAAAPKEEKDKRFKKLERNYIIATIITCCLLIGGLVIVLTNPTFTKMQEEMMSKLAQGIITCLL
jgi:predicted MFS family arabinose efflux permease